MNTYGKMLQGLDRTYVAPKNSELLREDKLRQIEQYVEQIAQLAVSCNLSKQNVIDMITFCMEERECERGGT